ncbi:MAG: oligosaccharide flippase family protein [Chloroflexota bacterium]
MTGDERVPAVRSPRALAGRAGGAMRSTTTLLGSDLRSYGLATFADQGGRMILNLVAAGMLGPVVFGTWVLVASIIQYSAFSSLGIVNGAAREIPRALGAGDPERARRIEDVATGGALVTGVVAGLAMIVLSPILFGPDVQPWLVALAVLMTQLFVLQQILFRANLRFREAAGQLGVAAVGAPVVGIPMLRFGVDGLIAARVIVNALVVTVAARRFGRLPRPRLDRAMLAQLISVGLPVMLGGLVFALLITLDRWLADILLGREAVGQYGIVSLAVSALLIVPTFLAQQLYPRISHERGAGAHGQRLLEVAIRFGVLAGLATAALGMAGSVFAVVAIPIVLPEYEEAIIPLIVGALAVSVFALSSGLGYVLNLTGRQRELVLAQAGALVGDVVLSLLFVNAGVGLVSFSLAMLVTFSVYGVVLWFAARHAARTDRGAHHDGGVRPTGLDAAPGADA